MNIPMDLSVSTAITLDERFFGAANNEQIAQFADKANYIKNVCEVQHIDDEVTITFEATLPGDARKAVLRFIKGNPL